VDRNFAECSVKHEELVGIRANHDDICCLKSNEPTLKNISAILMKALDATMSLNDMSLRGKRLPVLIIHN
jgi:hypothetical protein